MPNQEISGLVNLCSFAQTSRKPFRRAGLLVAGRSGATVYFAGHQPESAHLRGFVASDLKLSPTRTPHVSKSLNGLRGRKHWHLFTRGFANRPFCQGPSNHAGTAVGQAFMRVNDILKGLWDMEACLGEGRKPRLSTLGEPMGKGVKMVTLQKIIAELTERHGSLRAVARVLEIDAGYLSRLARGGKKCPSDSLLRRMGIRKVTTFSRIEK